MEKLKFGILGAGCGGQSMAAILTSQGCTVKLMDKNAALVQELKDAGTITLTGKMELQASPSCITTDAAEAIEGADVILVVTTADGHEDVARAIANVIQPNQIVVLNPGMFCGSLAFRTALRRFGCPHDILVAEMADLMFACRKAGPATVFHSGLKKKAVLAAVPASGTDRVVALLKPYFPIVTGAEDILHTAMSSIGCVLHCVPMIMNVNKLDAGQRFDYYMEGITPSIARMAEQVDAERIALARALGIEVPTTAQSVINGYGSHGDNLYEVIQTTQAYVGIQSPASLAHRFCAEDTFGSLVGFATLAKELGVPTPGMDAIITCISMATGIDYFTAGRTAEKVGLKGKTVAEIYEMIR